MDFVLFLSSKLKKYRILSYIKVSCHSSLCINLLCCNERVLCWPVFKNKKKI